MSETPPGIMVVSRGNHPGLDRGLAWLVQQDRVRASTHEVIPDGLDADVLARRWRAITDRVDRDGLELVVLWHYHGPLPQDLAAFVDHLRSLPHRPTVAFVGGDPFFNGFFRPALPESFRQACRSVDVVVNSAMGVMADALVDHGARRVAMLPHGGCSVRFPLPPEPHDPSRAEFDVCFIGSRNTSRHPGRTHFWYGRRRTRLVRALTQRFGNRFAVFGHGWDGLVSAQGPIAFERQLEACRRARVVVGGVPFSPARYYASDRPFNQIVAGVPFVDVATEGVERILRDGEHWHLVPTWDRVVDRVEALLSQSDDERQELGLAAARFVAAEHDQVRRSDQLLTTVLAARAAESGRPAPPDLGFFLPEVDRGAELPLATRGWDDAVA